MKDLQSFKHALHISAVYLSVGFAWIYFSDMWIEFFAHDLREISVMQTYKGFFFIAVTTLLLFLLSYHFLHKRFLEYTKYLEQQKQAQNLLAQQDALLASIVNSSPDAIFAKNLDGEYILFNQGAGEMVGTSPDKVIGQKDEFIFSSEAAEHIRQTDLKILSTKQIHTYEEYLFTAAGDEKFFLITKGPLFNPEGDLFGLFGISRDITEEKLTEKLIFAEKERFDYMAHHDSLTGLPNRLSLVETLQMRCTHNDPFAFMFLDLDGFKEVNDSYGHRFGDQLLIKFAKILNEVTPQNTLIFRTGGDEFVLLVRHDQNTSQIDTMMHRLVDKLHHPFNINGIDIYITASVGIAMFPHDATNSEDLFQKADSAMYNAKKTGKNTYSFYESKFTEASIQRTTISTNLKKALINRELSLYFQPQIDVTTHKIIGVETLCRWFNEEGPISPALFIPIAEESGLILEIGEFVLSEGCRHAIKWSQNGWLNGRVAINVSPHQLSHADFLPMLDQIIASTGCDPRTVELEITESSILENPEYTIKILHEIKKRGFFISIDDFGTGYSSLSYLKNLPIDKLKIDISFVRNITEEEKNQTIVKTIIALAKGLGMEVLAEGVETAEELDFLRLNGIDTIQGYYFYQPMPCDTFEHSLTLEEAKKDE